MTIWDQVWDTMKQGGLIAAIAVGLFAWVRRKMKLLDNAVQRSDIEMVKNEVARAVKIEDCKNCKEEILTVRDKYFHRLDEHGQALGRIDGKLEIVVEWIKNQNKGE